MEYKKDVDASKTRKCHTADVRVWGVYVSFYFMKTHPHTQRRRLVFFSCLCVDVISFQPTGENESAESYELRPWSRLFFLSSFIVYDFLCSWRNTQNFTSPPPFFKIHPSSSCLEIFSFLNLFLFFHLLTWFHILVMTTPPDVSVWGRISISSPPTFPTCQKKFQTKS